MDKYIIALYMRLSLDDKKTQSVSIETQRKILTDYAESLEIPNCEIIEFVDMYNQRLIQCHAHGSVEKCLKQRLSADLNVLLKAFFFVCSVFDVEAV